MNSGGRVTAHLVTSLWTGCNNPTIWQDMEICDTIDATGLLCPLPVLKLRKRLKPLEKGQCIRMLADDPAAVIDVPHFCAEAGHELVASDDQDGLQSYIVRKA